MPPSAGGVNVLQHTLPEAQVSGAQPTTSAPAGQSDSVAAQDPVWVNPPPAPAPPSAPPPAVNCTQQTGLAPEHVSP
ncbi:MAG: hypothetical protein JOZ69_20660 [Myxococcales bacterium]|nr:hypothetical protein [Myxococcales bacterium]